MVRFPRQIDNCVDKYLEIWYTVLNREIFSSKLPKDLKVSSGRAPGHRAWTRTKDTSHEVLYVRVDPRDPELLLVLIHEMCHVYHAHVQKYNYNTGPEHDHTFAHLEKMALKKFKSIFK